MRNVTGWRRCFERRWLAIAASGLMLATGCGDHDAGTNAGAGTPPPASSSGATPPPVTPVAGSSVVDVLTWHNDGARSGLNAAETALTPTTVAQASFGKIAEWSVDGAVDGQPLVAGGVAAADGSRHDLVIVATEHGTVYAFDVASGTALWSRSLMGAGEVPSDPRSCSQVSPEIGVTSTPVIDRGRGAGVLYVVAMSKNASNQYFQRLHALDLSSGAEIAPSPVTIAASYPGTGDNSVGGQVVFDPAQYKERAALLLQGGVVYTSWASHCDIRKYTGWLISFDATTLALRDVLNITPNGEGGASWGAGAGPAADSSGALYFLAGNGTFDTTLNASGMPQLADYGNAFLKLATTGGLTVADYFATFDTVAQSNADSDLGSGGAMVLPDVQDVAGATHQLALGAGKDAKIYVVDRTALGHFKPTDNGGAYQVVDGALGGAVFAAPAYFNGVVYYGAVGDALKALPIRSARLAATASSQSPASFGYPGTTPSVSANGNSGAVIWAVENATTAVLHAYDASNLGRELYNSNQAGSRDQFGTGNKFVTPTVSGGRVYVGTPSTVAVFGLIK
jgi:hypothetical protein